MANQLGGLRLWRLIWFMQTLVSLHTSKDRAGGIVLCVARAFSGSRLSKAREFGLDAGKFQVLRVQFCNLKGGCGR